MAVKGLRKKKKIWKYLFQRFLRGLLQTNYFYIHLHNVDPDKKKCCSFRSFLDMVYHVGKIYLSIKKKHTFYVKSKGNDRKIVDKVNNINKGTDYYFRCNCGRKCVHNYQCFKIWTDPWEDDPYRTRSSFTFHRTLY